MDFTREPVIETIITPKEGFKLVVRSSKSSGQEEYFVDSVEVVSFGNSLFFRSLERPKSFLVPVTDYEILEVREARMVLKNVGVERSIKIGGGREPKPSREVVQERVPQAPAEETVPAGESAQVAESSEGRMDKRRDKRRHSRRRRGREDLLREGATEETAQEDAKIDLAEPLPSTPRETPLAEPLTTSSSILSSILPPPPTLISDSIARYKENALFSGAFFMRDPEKVQAPKGEEEEPIAIPEPHLGPFAITPEEEADIYQHRATFTHEESSTSREGEDQEKEDDEGTDQERADTEEISNGHT